MKPGIWKKVKKSAFTNEWRFSTGFSTFAVWKVFDGFCCMTNERKVFNTLEEAQKEVLEFWALELFNQRNLILKALARDK